MRISDWSSDVCSSDLLAGVALLLVWRLIIKPLLADNEASKAQRQALADEEDKNREEIAAAERRASEMPRYEENMATARAMAEKDPRAVADRKSTRLHSSH